MSQLKFHLEINSFEAFVLFCNFIKVNEINDEKILEITKKLKESDNSLAKAVASATPTETK